MRTLRTEPERPGAEPDLSELARRDRRSRALLSALHDGFNVVDRDGRIVEVNDRLCQMTGWSAAELVGAVPPFPYWPPDQHDRIRAAFRNALDGELSEFELTFQRRGGERFPVSIDVSPLTDEGEGFLAVIRDVTDAVRERERLREAHEVARLLSWEWDPASNLFELSYGAEAVRAGLEGVISFADVGERVPEPHAGHLRAALERVAAGDAPEVTLEYPVTLADSEAGWVETRARPVLDPHGRVTRVRGTTQDITPRKRAELALERSEDSLRQAQRMADIGSFEIDYRTGDVTWSRQLHRMFGVQDSAIRRVGEVRSHMPADDAARVRRCAEEVVADGRPRQIEHDYMRGDERRRAEMRFEPLEADGERYGVRATLQDVTERTRAEREVHLQASLLDAVDVAVIATDLSGAVTHWNRGAERMYGWTRAQAMGRPVADLTVGPDERERAVAITESVRATGRWEGELEVRRADGTVFPAFVGSATFDDLDGNPAGVVGVSIDVTERVAGERHLRSARDYLRAITDSLGEGLFTLDTDDRLIYMNPAAEAMLGWTGAELAGQVMHDVTHYRRPDGTPVSVEECPLRAVRRSGETVRLEDDVMIRRDGTELPVEITAAPFETADGVRGTVVVFSDISERKAEELRRRREVEALSWVGRIRDALAEDRLVLHAQPIIDVATGETVQHELLIRMIGGDGSLVAPGEFLPTAEEYGLIGEIDRWVVREAIELAGRGHAVELNLSAHSIGAPGLIEEFREHLDRTGADPGLIVVELTETALVADEAAAQLFTTRIEALGCELALDDFGTGYGGFSYLKRLPVDYLKIDVEFVRDLATNEASRHVVSAVVSLARGFGQQTVAEGVEDLETLRLLEEFGVDYAQGFAIGRPAPLAEALGQADSMSSIR